MAGGRISEKYREYGCNESDVVMLGIATRDSSEEILYGYNRNGCDSIQFGLITQEGGAAEIGEIMGYSGKAGPTFLIAPDKSISDELYYSDYAIDKCFKDAGIAKNACSDTLLAPTVRFVSPKMKEIVLPDSTYDIAWVSRDSDGIAATVLFYSPDDGKSWNYIDSIEGADSTYSWEVPNLYSDRCRIKARVYDRKGYEREKISIYFTINGSVSVVSPDAMIESLGSITIKGRSLNFSRELQRAGELELFDTRGRRLWVWSMKKGEKRGLLGHSLSPGVYTISVQCEKEKKIYQKITIE